MPDRPSSEKPAVERSLNASLGGAVGAIAVVSVLTGAAALLVAGELRRAIVDRDHAAEISRSVNGLRAAMLDQETGERGFLLTDDPTSLAPYRDGRAAFDRVDAHLHELVPRRSDMWASVADADNAARAWQRAIGEPAAHGATDLASRREAMRREASGEGRAYVDRLRLALDPVLAEARTRRLRADRRLVTAAWGVAIAIGIGIAVTLAICVAVSRALRRGVTEPLLALAEAMRRLAGRDLAAEVPGTDAVTEVGAMARAVAVFKRNLIELDRTSVLRATADTLPAMVGYVAADRRIGFLNAEFGRVFALGGDMAAMSGRELGAVFAAFPGEDAGALAGALAGEERRFECRLAPRPGAPPLFCEAFFRPHRVDGAVHGVVTLLTDITERKRTELLLASQAAELARSNEELAQFAYVASHDLKAPLRGIENLVTWIAEDLGTVEEGVAANMALLRSRVHRLEHLLDDLLAYSRAGSGQGDAEEVDIHALVDELAALISPPAGFRIEAEGDLLTIRTPRGPLAQALQNLIGNAIKHHDRAGEGHVWVRAERERGVPVFTVSDDGPGVPTQFRERVFGMFQTLRPRDEVEGSGMGLAIVRKLVERRGGTVVLGDRPDAAAGQPARGLLVRFTWPEGSGSGQKEG